MILGFSTKIKGKETYFVEKIQRAISKDLHDPLIDYKVEWFNSFIYFKVKPKLHTIREDKKDRWKAGMMIDFFINVRKKDMFRFAPVLPVVRTQKIEIVHYVDGEVLIHGVPIKKKIIIDDKRHLNEDEILQLAKNDGFDTVEDFFDYFKEDFKGKIIHWTDFTY